MTEQAPFKVVPYDIGAANVIDRASGEKIGYVLGVYCGWEAFLSLTPGVPLVFEKRRWPDWRIAKVMRSDTYDVVVTKYQADAAEKVYASWLAIQEGVTA